MASVGGGAQQVVCLHQGVELVLRHQDRGSTFGHDLDLGAVEVDPLNETAKLPGASLVDTAISASWVYETS